MSCSNLYIFINTPTMLIVLCGVFCGTIGSHPVKTIGNAFRDVFSSDIESEERALQGHQVFSNMSKYAIVSGLVGMMIGLISLLSNMEDPSAIGPAMGVALLNPFYGVLVGMFFFHPLANACLSRKNIVVERQSS
jgi:flagellar motor component MotA